MMAKGNVVLKIIGILLILFGVLGILWAMYYGFVGALGFSDMGKSVVTGLLIFYGLYGILVGFFQIAAGALCIRHSNKPEHWLRCVIWGIVILILGIACYIVLKASSGMIHPDTQYYPPWFGFGIVIAGGIVLPVLMILGGVLNKLSYVKNPAKEAASEDSAEYYPAEAAAETVETTVEDITDKAAVTAAEITETAEETEGAAAETVTAADNETVTNALIPAMSGGRLEFLKNQRLTRNVDPRLARKFRR